MTRPLHAATLISLASAAQLILGLATAQAGDAKMVLSQANRLEHFAQAIKLQQQAAQAGTVAVAQPVSASANAAALLPQPVGAAGRSIRQGTFCRYSGAGCRNYGERHGGGYDRNPPVGVSVNAVEAPPQIYVQPGPQVIVLNAAALQQRDPEVIAAPPQASYQHGVRVIYLTDPPAEFQLQSGTAARVRSARHTKGAYALPVERPITAKD